MDKTQHWEKVYQTKSAAEVSWYEPDPQQSIELILSATGPSRGRVIDVGGGQSFLVDRLLEVGFSHVAVLDISSAAIEATKARLGDRSGQVEWIVSDITQVKSLGQFDVWHDRAVFHFVTDAADRRRYVELLQRTLPIGGHFVVGTFAKGGPEKCSGLEICQYDAESMAKELGNSFQLLKARPHSHETPSGQEQAFFFGVFRRVK